MAGPAKFGEQRHHTVTGMAQDPRVPGNLVIEVNGTRFGSLPLEIVRELNVVVGQDLNEAGFAKLSAAALAEGAYHVAVRLLAARPRGVREMVRALRDRGHPSTAIDHAIDRLSAADLLNDDAFARHFARTRSARGHGAGRLVADLRSRGVDGGVAETAVRETLEAEGADPLAQASQLVAKRSSQMANVPADAKRRRLLAYLDRRGFRGYEYTRLVEEAVKGRGEGA